MTVATEAAPRVQA